MARKSIHFGVNSRLINSTIDKSKNAVSGSVVYTRLLLTAIVLDVLIMLAVFLLKGHLPPEVPLLYGLAEGQDQLVNKTSLVLPSLISIIIILFNTTMSIIITDEYLRKALVITAFASSIVALIATIEIVMLVGNL